MENWEESISISKVVEGLEVEGPKKRRYHPLNTKIGDLTNRPSLSVTD